MRFIEIAHYRNNQANQIEITTFTGKVHQKIHWVPCLPEMVILALILGGKRIMT